jgi:hypothetical protein
MAGQGTAREGVAGLVRPPAAEAGATAGDLQHIFDRGGPVTLHPRAAFRALASDGSDATTGTP